MVRTVYKTTKKEVKAPVKHAAPHEAEVAEAPHGGKKLRKIKKMKKVKKMKMKVVWTSRNAQ